MIIIQEKSSLNRSIQLINIFSIKTKPPSIQSFPFVVPYVVNRPTPLRKSKVRSEAFVCQEQLKNYNYFFGQEYFFLLTF